MNRMIPGLLLILVAGLFQGTWALGVKRSEPLSWGAFWAPFSFIGMIVIPLVWVNIAIPDLRGVLRETPSEVMWKPFVYGAVWGIGAVTFGLAIKYIGMSLSYGINMGVASSVGALIPFFRIGNLSASLVSFVLTGIFIMLAGILLITWAGILRNRYQGTGDAMLVQEGHTRVGIIFALVGGLATAAFNVGFSYALPVVDIAVARGATPANGSLIAWLFVLSGGFILNFGYASYLVVKNRAFSEYRAEGSGRGLFVMIITAVFWFAAIGLYGQGAAVMGELGPVAGWVMFMALALIVSNLWGLRTGEWKGMTKPLRYLYAGNLILIVSWIILGYSNTL